jgi:hypothetical protein
LQIVNPDMSEANRLEGEIFDESFTNRNLLTAEICGCFILHSILFGPELVEGHSSFFILHSSFFILHSSFFILLCNDVTQTPTTIKHPAAILMIVSVSFKISTAAAVPNNGWKYIKLPVLDGPHLLTPMFMSR